MARNYLVDTLKASDDGVEVFNVAKRHHDTSSSNDSRERPSRSRRKKHDSRKEPRVVIKVPPKAKVVESSIPAVAGPSSLMVEPPGPDSMTIDPPVITKKLRAPPKRLPVEKRPLDTWDRLDSVAAPITFKDWLMNDKNAREQLKQGLRFIDGRKSRKAGKKPMNSVNNITIEDTYSSSSDDYDSTSDTTSSYDDYQDSQSVTSVGALEHNDSDDDTVYDYPYHKQALLSSTPLYVNGTIFDKKVKVVIDSGSSISLLSKSIALQLGLIGTGDRIPISTLDTTSTDHAKSERERDCEVTVAVPIRIGGKLRSEHMIIKDDSDSIRGEAVVLLGMTWLRQYDIKIHTKEALIEIPVKNGGSSILVQGWCTEEGYPFAPAREVFAVSVFGGDTVTDDCKFGPVDTTLNLDTQYKYIPDSLKSYLEEALPSEDEVVKGESKVDKDVEEQSVERLKEMPDSLACLLKKHKMQFSEFGGLGCIKGAEHHIQLKPGVSPVRSRPYKITWEEDEFLRAELDRLLSLGVIRRSSGLWTSPVFFVKKKPAGLRMVYDLRSLNQKTIREDFPLPRIQDLLDGFHGAKYFSVCDACSGFLQIKLSAESIPLTGHITKYGCFEMTRMPYGCQGGPGTYSREMLKMLGPYIGVCFHVFIDDICTFSATFSDHLKHLELLFNICKEYNLKLRFAKCHFMKPSVEYLGHTISADGVTSTQRNVQKLLDMEVPKDIAGIKSFVATANFYRRSLKNVASVALPLTSLLKKGAKFFWGAEQQEAFDKIKEMLTQAPVLAYPDRKQVQILTTDASSKGIGCILSQSPDGTENNETVVAYGSRTLRGAETRYSATHLEAFAVVWSVNYFRQYLAGRRFVLRTDHSSLKFIFENENPSPKVDRWAAALMGYDYEVRYIRGVENPTDSISRLI